MKIKFFKSPVELRKWLDANHAGAAELWVGYYKKDSGRPSVTWPESVDEALCFGWIDGVRKSVDEISYTIRFSPRKSRSIWSAINIRRAEELIKEGLMQPAGLIAFQARAENRSGIYSYEQRSTDLPEQYAKRIRANKEAWKFYQSQSDSYRKKANWWVISAKKEDTRLKRLDRLIKDSEKGQSIQPLTRVKKA